METKKIDNFYNILSYKDSMGLFLNEREFKTVQNSYKAIIDKMSNIEKLDALYDSIDYVRENSYNDINRYKNLLSQVHATKNYNFGISYAYFYRIIKNWKISTLNRALSVFVKYQYYLDFDNINLESVIRLFIVIKKSKDSHATKCTEWRKLKQMFKFASFNIDLTEFVFPEARATVKPEDLLTKSEFNAIVDGLGSHQYGKGLEYQAFFMLLADTGIRTGEAFTISKRKLIENKEGNYEVLVDGKTGERTVVLAHSSLVFKLLIMEGWTEWTFNYYAFRSQLKRVCLKLKLTYKRVYNHLLRHNFGSYIATNSSTTPEIKKKFGGWSLNSSVFEKTYVHIKNKEVLEKMLPVLRENPLFND